MQIQELFQTYKQLIDKTENIDFIFQNSGMENRFALLDFGFFPIGSGILTNQSEIESAKIDDCEIMVLGNDFGTIDYVNHNCPNKREKQSNPTIKNLLNLGLNPKRTFFTNLFMGLRISGKNTDPKKISEDYKKFCFVFFKMQLELLNPKIVLCMGTEVLKSLSAFSTDFSFYSKTPISELFIGANYIVNSGGRKFVLIPHPSYAHINWTKNNIKQKIKEAIKV